MHIPNSLSLTESYDKRVTNNLQAICSKPWPALHLPQQQDAVRERADQGGEQRLSRRCIPPITLGPGATAIFLYGDPSQGAPGWMPEFGAFAVVWAGQAAGWALAKAAPAGVVV